MGLQLGFFAINDDHIDLTTYIDKLGFVAVPTIIPTDSLPKAKSIFEYVLTDSERCFYLLPSEFAVVEAFYKELKLDSSKSGIMPFNSPVIEFGPCYREGKKVFASRIYLATDISDPRYEVVRAKYDLLDRYIKKWHRLPTTHPIYIGSSTRASAEAGEIRLFHDFLEITLL